MGAMKNHAMSSGSMTPRQKTSYDRFYVNAFSDADIDEIVEQGGIESVEDFKEVTKNRVKEKGYWDAMFQQTWKSKKDGKTRVSQYQRLGDAMYKEYFKGLTPKVKVREIRRQGKEKVFVYKWLMVDKGQKVKYQNKWYRGGQRLPSSYRKR
jgi:hypothetical protein